MQNIEDIISKPYGLVMFEVILLSENGHFLKQLTKVAEQEGNILIQPVEEIAFGIENNKRFFVLNDGTKIFDDSPNKPSWVMMRGNFSNVAFFLECMGIPCYPSSRMIDLASDKSLASAFFATYFDSPDILLTKGKMTLDNLQPAQYPYIVKCVHGCCGNDVYRVPDDAYRRVVESKYNKDHPLVYQHACPTGDDLRVYIVEGEIVGAIARRVSEGHWKANCSAAPTREEYILNDGERQQIMSAIAALPEHHGFITFDFLFDENDNICFCEANTNPGIEALRCLGIMDDLTRNYITMLHSKAGITMQDVVAIQE